MTPRDIVQLHPGEPSFTLLARDPLAAFLVSIWSSACLADHEAAAVKFNTMFTRGVPAITDIDLALDAAGDAMDVALAMFAWRKANGDQCGQPAFIRESTKAKPGGIEHALRATIMALRSYQHGNAARDLAQSIADAGDEALRAAGLPPATHGAMP